MMAMSCSQDYIPQSPDARSTRQRKEETTFGNIRLRSIDEIPPKYRHLFRETPYFNVVQSTVLDDALYNDNSLVVCAPTGSGKTLIFELAVVRMLLKSDQYGQPRGEQKVVYMAPIKALCSQRYSDWAQKFDSIGMQCALLTGDSNNDDLLHLQKANIILTTPEKWDSTTRRWQDNSSVVNQIKLFLIDEVHLLNDETRGATMEAVVSRMKTKHAYLSTKHRSECNAGLRFVAVSATIPNVEDIADWLGSKHCPAVHYSVGEHLRPVKLQLVVLGYPCYSNSEFKFDVTLNYKIGSVITTYSEGKPTLVFCSTRKSAEQAGIKVSKDLKFVANASHKAVLNQLANLVRCHKLRECLLSGVGYHHAGLDIHDRQLVEKGFTGGHILVLFSTSTLAMGVNLPAHLVIIKSTSHYVGGICEEYSQSEIMQMIGRAGRPQYDTFSIAVIMTKEKNRVRYQNIVSGSKKIESSLHTHLIEHLNAEIALTTIHDVGFAAEWIRSTFLYIRALKNPSHYGYSEGSSAAEIQQRLQELCTRNVEALSTEGLVNVNSSYQPSILQATPSGRLMAQYCIAFKTMIEFSRLTGKKSMADLVVFLSNCKEFQDLTLRVNEKNVLNKLNINKTGATIRFSMSGKVKTTQMKVNCLLQATLGNLTIQDFALQQDITKIFRTAARVSRCLVEYQMLQNDFETLLNAARLGKCIKARMWENSRYICKQLPGIGPVLAAALANSGITTFQAVSERNPRELEMIVNRHPPFGNQMQEAVKYLPRYSISMESVSENRSYGVASFKINVSLDNADALRKKQTIFGKHMCLLLVGDSNNDVILKQRIADVQLLNSAWSRNIEVKQISRTYELKLVLSSQEWVGLDIENTYTPFQNSTYPMMDTPLTTTPGNSDVTSSYFADKKSNDKGTLSWKRRNEENETSMHKSFKFSRRRLPTNNMMNSGNVNHGIRRGYSQHAHSSADKENTFDKEKKEYLIIREPASWDNKANMLSNKQYSDQSPYFDQSVTEKRCDDYSKTHSAYRCLNREPEGKKVTIFTKQQSVKPQKSTHQTVAVTDKMPSSIWSPVSKSNGSPNEILSCDENLEADSALLEYLNSEDMRDISPCIAVGNNGDSRFTNAQLSYAGSMDSDKSRWPADAMSHNESGTQCSAMRKIYGECSNSAKFITSGNCKSGSFTNGNDSQDLSWSPVVSQKEKVEPADSYYGGTEYDDGLRRSNDFNSPEREHQTEAAFVPPDFDIDYPTAIHAQQYSTSLLWKPFPVLWSSEVLSEVKTSVRGIDWDDLDISDVHASSTNAKDEAVIVIDDGE